MFKTIGLFKRRPGMTVEEFREYYETKHRVIGEKYLRGYASRYFRRFLDPVPGNDNGGEVGYDVLLEIWFPDQETFEAAGEILSAPDVAAEIAAEEEKLFDRPSMCLYFVEEFESDMGF